MRVESIMNNLVQKTGPVSKSMWELGLKIYYDFMISMYHMTDTFTDEEKLDLLKNGEWHRSTMCIAFEIMRSSNNVLND